MSRVLAGFTVLVALVAFRTNSLPAQPAPVMFEDVSGATIGRVAARDWGWLAVGDYDGDGWDDLYIGQHGVVGEPEPRGHPYGARLFRNTRNGTFTETTTLLARIEHHTQHRHVAVWCDFTNNGREDLYIGTGHFDHHDAVGHHDLLLLNNGGGFTTIVLPRDPANVTKAFAATCVDVDNDGRQDILVLNKPQDAQFPSGTPIYRLFMNHEGGPGGIFFTEEAAERGLGASTTRRGNFDPFALTCADFNRDGDMDCFSASGNQNRYILNRLIAVAPYQAPKLLPVTGNYLPIAGLGPYGANARWADFTGDGWLDLVWFDQAGVAARVKVYRNNQSATHVADGLVGHWNSAQVSTYKAASRGMAVGDLNNDGHLDIFHTVLFGAKVDGTSAKGPDVVFLNRGDGRFDEYQEGMGAIHGGDLIRTRTPGGGGAAIIDFDRDGRLDIIAGYAPNESTRVGPIRLLRNVTQNPNGWVGFLLRGPRVLGAWVDIDVCGRRQTDQVTSRTGYLGQSSRDVHFGLGACAGPVSVKVTWPDGQIWQGQVAARSYHVITR